MNGFLAENSLRSGGLMLQHPKMLSLPHRICCTNAFCFAGLCFCLTPVLLVFQPTQRICAGVCAKKHCFAAKEGAKECLAQLRTGTAAFHGVKLFGIVKDLVSPS